MTGQPAAKPDKIEVHRTADDLATNDYRFVEWITPDSPRNRNTTRPTPQPSTRQPPNTPPTTKGPRD